MSQRRQRWLWALFGLAGVVLVGVALLYRHDYGWMGDRISWSCVARPSIEQFRSQIVRELPPGTSQQAVEDYLARRKIPFTYSYPRYPSYRKPILIEEDLPGDWGNPLGGWVQVFIVFDRDGVVAEIDFRQQRK